MQQGSDSLTLEVIEKRRLEAQSRYERRKAKIEE